MIKYSTVFYAILILLFDYLSQCYSAIIVWYIILFLMIFCMVFLDKVIGYWFIILLLLIPEFSSQLYSYSYYFNIYDIHLREVIIFILFLSNIRYGVLSRKYFYFIIFVIAYMIIGLVSNNSLNIRWMYNDASYFFIAFSTYEYCIKNASFKTQDIETIVFSFFLASFIKNSLGLSISYAGIGLRPIYSPIFNLGGIIINLFLISPNLINLIKIIAVVDVISKMKGRLFILQTIAIPLLYTFFGPKKEKLRLLVVLIITMFYIIMTQPLMLFWNISSMIDYKNDYSIVARISELEAIISDNPIHLMIGKGFGGKFNISRIETKIEFASDDSDYSKDQKETGYIYRPHSFVNIFLLKFGLLGTVIFFTIVYKDIKNRYAFLLFLFSIEGMIYTVSGAILSGMLLAISSSVPNGSKR